MKKLAFLFLAFPYILCAQKMGNKIRLIEVFENEVIGKEIFDPETYNILIGEEDAKKHLQLDWKDEYLLITGTHLTAPIKVHYIEAFVRSGSSNQHWNESVLPHQTRLVSKAKDGSSLHLQSELPILLESNQASAEPTVVVEHYISATTDEISFLVIANNRGNEFLNVLWAQPCIRVADFTGRGLKWYEENHYLDACFVFVDDNLTPLNATPRSSNGFYTPGQVYAPELINRDDLNPRPLSSAIPSNGLIGCYSKNDSMLIATAWQPYQELFQGIATCIHSDFRIGGLEAGQTKTIRGKIYVLENDIEELLKRYRRDFGE